MKHRLLVIEIMFTTVLIVSSAGVARADTASPPGNSQQVERGVGKQASVSPQSYLPQWSWRIPEFADASSAPSRADFAARLVEFQSLSSGASSGLRRSNPSETATVEPSRAPEGLARTTAK